VIERKVVDRYAHQSGVKDQLVAEREVVLTYALHALVEAKTLDQLAFKGGTCLRKIVFGSPSLRPTSLPTRRRVPATSRLGVDCAPRSAGASPDSKESTMPRDVLFARAYGLSGDLRALEGARRSRKARGRVLGDPPDTAT
jgi:hypothetical protein